MGDYRMLIAIDPGVNGAIAFRDWEGRVFLETMPDTPREVYDVLRDYAVMARTEGHPVEARLERVGDFFPGSKASPAALVKLSRHYGELRAFLIALEVPFLEVRPAHWMRQVIPDLPKGYAGGVSAARKRLIKKGVQQAFPSVKGITLQTADALGILLHFMRGG